MLEVDARKLPKWIHEHGIKRITDEETRRNIGADMLSFTKRVKSGPFDSLVFLDKSARPVEWMFREMWHLMYPQDRLPDVHFANIGKEKYRLWGNSRKKTLRESVLADTESSNRLREAFTIGDSYETYFDHKSVLLVDEITVSRETLDIAEALFTGAFRGRADRIEKTAVFGTLTIPWYSPASIENEGLRKEKLIGVWDLKEEELLSRPLRLDPNLNAWFRNQLSAIAQEAVAADSQH